MNFFDFFKKSPTSFSSNKIHPVVLIVLDGWGVAPESDGNAIFHAKTPNMDAYKTHYPYTTLIASGESVGLPANEVGNTEVGHLTMGAGRVVYQDVMRINHAIENKTFYSNTAFIQATNHVKKHNSKLHLMGMIGMGNVHSSLLHLYGLIELCKEQQINQVYIHAFTDGRDTSPRQAAETVGKLEEHLKIQKTGRIATIMGRYYGMDRDRRWDRTEAAYRTIVEGKGLQSTSAVEAVKKIYADEKTDEFVEPTNIIANGAPVATVDNNDAVIFFNFRIDRPRQLTMAFVMPDFEQLRKFEFGYSPHEKKVEGEVKFKAPFTREKKPQNVFFVTMTQYQKNLPVSAIAFDEQVVPRPLSVVLSEKNYKQFRLAESEKERFVTYYFDGLRDGKIPGVDIKIIPSPRVSTYDKKPEMSAGKLVAAFKDALSKDMYHFYAMNFPNSDIVGHTGNVKAAIKACEVVDMSVGEVVRSTLSCNGAVLITADHGNAEEMLRYKKKSFFFTTEKGRSSTDHSNNPVPFSVVSARLAGKAISSPSGTLSDIAPTVLGLLGVAKPEEMTGKNLLATQ